MLTALARHWWLIALRGVAAIAFGVLAFVWPEITLVVLVALFAAYALVDGASMLVMTLRGQRSWEIGLFGVARHPRRALHVPLSDDDRTAPADLHRRLGRS